MAKFQMTPFAGQGSGKYLGMVVYHAKGDSVDNRVRTYTKDIEQPRTPLQLRNRAVVTCCAELWQGFTDPDKAYWNARATRPLNGWNMFTQYNLLQSSRYGWMPQLQKNNMHLGAPAAPTALTATVVAKAIRVTWTDGTLSYTTGLHLGKDPGFVPTMDNLVYATLATDGEDRQDSIRVAPGTWYLKARSGDSDGGTGAPTTGIGPLVIE